MRLTIDLYELYKDRLKNNLGIVIVSDVLFFGLIRIMLVCDAIHDFSGNRVTGIAPDVKNKIINSITGSMRRDLEYHWPGLENMCYEFIEGRGNDFIPRDKYFINDENAKKVVNRIMTKLGFQKIPLSTVTLGDCSNDSSILRIIDIMNIWNPVNRGTGNDKFQISVDMTSSTINLLPVLASILNNERFKQSGCSGVSKDIKLKYDLSSMYDAANVETIFKAFNASGLVDENPSDIYFEIDIGRWKKVIVCKLERVSSGGDIKAKLIMYKFFSDLATDASGNYIPIITMDNDYNGRTQNNSVKGLLEVIKKPTINEVDTHRLIITKTMGDFLQIMTFSDPMKDFNKIFVTGDIICNSIASLFNKFSIGEIKDTAKPVLEGLGIYVTEQEQLEYFSPYNLMSISRKRARTDFGNTIKSLSIKTLKERLTSVGIKVTKTIKGKKVQLSRTELENKAKSFKKLQIKAKEKGIKLKTKSGNFKSKESLDKELAKQKSRFG